MGETVPFGAEDTAGPGLTRVIMVVGRLALCDRVTLGVMSSTSSSDGSGTGPDGRLDGAREGQLNLTYPFTCPFSGRA